MQTFIQVAKLYCPIERHNESQLQQKDILFTHIHYKNISIYKGLYKEFYSIMYKYDTH